MKKILYILLILSAPVYADWMKVVSTSNEDTDIYIELNSIRKNGNSVLFWHLQDYKQKNELGDLSMKLKQEINCKEETIKTIALVSYSGNMGSGNVTTSGNGSGQITHIPPGTLKEEIYKFVCNKK